MTAEKKMNYHFEDFTEDQYRRLLQLAKKNWRFIDFPSYRSQSRTCLWRHDVEFSVHRAHHLAEIEAEEGVKATYFINLHSDFYNPLDGESIRLIRNIVDLGHFLGVHFDATAYLDTAVNQNWLVEKITNESHIIEQFFNAPVNCVSFHNPGTWNAMVFDDDEIAGLVNAYGRTIRDNFVYVSDSNGYWRHQRLQDIVRDTSVERLHVLTHDAWWQNEVSSPNDRIQRCIQDRADNVWKQYKNDLLKSNRSLVDKVD